MTAPIPRNCPSCGRSASQLRWNKEALRVVACTSCDLWYADPVPPEMVSGAFYDHIGTSYYLSPDKLQSDHDPVRFVRELRLFRRHCPRGEVLDIGCSTGAFLHRLRTLGSYRGTGLDVAGPALDHAASLGLPVIREPFLEHDFEERRFHAVTIWAVLEHLAAPLAFLRKAASLLRPGGHCFVLVPNRGSLATRLLGSRYRYVMPDHLNYFSRPALLDLVARVPQLEVVRITTMMFNPVVILQDLLHPRPRVPDAQRAGLLRRTTGWKRSPWLLPLRCLYRAGEAALSATGLADNLVAVARRRIDASR